MAKFSLLLSQFYPPAMKHSGGGKREQKAPWKDRENMHKN
jgi:hypothetical protein